MSSKAPQTETRGDEQFVEIWNAAADRYTKITGLSLATTASGSVRKRSPSPGSPVAKSRRSFFHRSKSPGSPDPSPSPPPGRPPIQYPLTAESLLQSLEDTQGRFEKFREKREKLRNVLSPLVTTVEIFSELISGGAEFAFPPSTLVFGAVNILINAAENVTNSYDSVIELFENLKAFATRLTVHTRRAIAPELKEVMVKKLSLLLVITGLSLKLVKEGRAIKFIKHVFAGDDDEINDLVKDVDRFSAEEDSMVAALNLQVSYDTADGVGSIQSSLRKMGSDVNALMDMVSSKDAEVKMAMTAASRPKKDMGVETYEQTMKRLREELQPVLSMEADYENIVNEIVPTTCEWILTEPMFDNWFKGKRETTARSAVLYISGTAGCGKSHISARIIKWLKAQIPQDVQDTRRTGVAYFFCREGDTSRQSFTDIMRTIAYQLAANDFIYGKFLLNAIENLGRQGGDGGTLLSEGTVHLWKTLFVDFFKSKTDLKDNAYVVIDGLDEAFREGYDGVQSLLESMKEFYQDYPKGTRPRLQFLLVGRPDITDKVYDVLTFKTPMIELSANALSKDLEKYISYEMKRYSNLRNMAKRNPMFKQELVQKLTGKTFLWVKLVLKEVAGKNRESQMRQAIDNFPEDLAELVGQVVDRFSKNDQDVVNDLNELLAWITCTLRPLTLGELEHIMSLSSPDMEEVIDLERMLRIRYSTFFALVRSDGLGTADLQDMQRGVFRLDASEGEYDEAAQAKKAEQPDIPDDDLVFNSPKPTVVSISHLSFTEYFRKFPRTSDDKVGVNSERADLHIALRCLGVICDDKKYEKLKASSTLIYAATSFFIHLSRVDRSKTSIEDKAAVLTYLHTAFSGTKAGSDGKTNYLPRWCGYVIQWAAFLYTNDYTDPLLQWIADEEALKGAHEDIVKWSKEVADGGLQALLQPAAMEYARQFWQGTQWGPFLSFKFVYCYVEKFKLYTEGKGFVSGYGPDLAWHKRPPLAIADVLAASDWTGIPKDALWHARTALMMRNCGDPITSLEYYKKAETADNFTPGIWHGLGKTYAELHRYKDAIHYTQKALEGNKDKENWGYGTRWEALWCVAAWKTNLSLGLEGIDGGEETYSVYSRSSLVGSSITDDAGSEVATQSKAKEKEEKEEKWRKEAEEKLKRQESMTDAEKLVAAQKERALVKERKQYRDEAMEAWKAAYDDNKTNYRFIQAYLEFCDEWEKRDEFMELLRKMDRDKTKKGNCSYSLLTDFLFFTAHADEDNDTLLYIAELTKNIPFLMEAYKKAIYTASNLPAPEPGLVGALRCWLGQVYYQQEDGQDQATDLFELVINDPSLQKTTTPYTSARVVAAELLAEIYYLAAAAAEKTAEDPSPYVMKLRRVGSNPSKAVHLDIDAPRMPGLIRVSSPFGEQPTKEDIEFWTYSTKETALLLGKWYRTHGKKAEAKAIFKELVSLSLDLLTDDIADNDDDGYSRLGYALLMAGDEKNARASYQLIGRYRPDEEKSVEEKTDDGHSSSSEQGDSEDEEEKEIKMLIRRESTFDSDDYVFTCTYCEEDFTFASGCHICTSGCSYVFFCWNCYRLCKKGKFMYKLCHKTHEFFYVSRRGLPRTETGMVRFVSPENKPVNSIPLNEWIAGLKQEWEI